MNENLSDLPNSGAIRSIPTTEESVFAFRITGQVEQQDVHEMAQKVNLAFDRFDEVGMLLIFDDFEGQDAGAIFDGETLKAEFRSLSKVQNYAVVGAPDAAASMIDFMDNLIPADARSFEPEEEATAWAFVGARPA